MPSAPAATAFSAIIFEFDLKLTTLEGFPVQSRYGGARLMPLHFEKSESLAATRKQILYQFQGSYGTEL
jgi:hypothetical protein